MQRGALIMKHTFRTLGISVLAAASGAGLALLFAPQSGERTRRLIRYKAGSYAKDLRDGVSDGAVALYCRGAESTRRAVKRLGKTLKPIGS
jgi:gas vesicle protein